jgi:hypothetical protein
MPQHHDSARASLQRLGEFLGQCRPALDQHAVSKAGRAAFDELASSIRNFAEFIPAFQVLDEDFAIQLSHVATAVEDSFAHWRSSPGDQGLEDICKGSLEAIGSQKAHLHAMQPAPTGSVPHSPADMAQRLTFLEAMLRERQEDLERLRGDINTRRSENDRLHEDLTTKFVQEQAGRFKVFGKAVEEQKAVLVNAQRKWEQAAIEHMAVIEKQRVSAEAIVGAIGNSAVASSFQRVAVTEGRQFQWFRGLTLLLLAAAVAVAILVVREFPKDRVDVVTVWTIVLRLICALAIAAPAFYTAREAARHKALADVAGRKQLELATLKPFLVDLPEERRSALLEKLAERYFGRDV